MHERGDLGKYLYEISFNSSQIRESNYFAHYVKCPKFLTYLSQT